MGGKKIKKRVAIAISRSELSAIVLDRAGNTQRVRGHQLPWQGDASSLHQDDGARQLTEALTTWVNDQRLTGATAYVTLSSEVCVTRVVAGDKERLKPELRALHDRCNQYLLLGAGSKVIAESARPLDAKNDQVLLTVTNKRTLETILQSVEDAGLRLNLVEHGLVAMCRAVGHMGRDADGPVIIVEINDRGVDLGISYQGQLLLDYRPGGNDCKDQIAEIVERHLQRIQRYCTRHFQFAKGNISEVFITGDPESAEHVRRQFASTSLAAEILHPRTVCPDWEFADTTGTDHHYLSAVGAALVEGDQLYRSPSERGLPNLIESLRNAHRGPLLPALAKTAWPVAAAILLAVMGYGMARVQDFRSGSLENRLVALEGDVAHVKSIQMETEAATAKAGYLDTINTSVAIPPYHHLIALIGRSMPKGIWLEELSVDRKGNVSIVGPSLEQDLIYEFVRYLEKLPVLDNVNLESQTPDRFGPSPVLKFKIRCQYVSRKGAVERTANNG